MVKVTRGSRSGWADAANGQVESACQVGIRCGPVEEQGVDESGVALAQVGYGTPKGAMFLGFDGISLR